jgi:hypothetical protein
MTTLTDAHPAPPAVTEPLPLPLDEGTSHALLFRAACAAEDDVLTELADARRAGDVQAVARLTAERGLFDRRGGA